MKLILWILMSLMLWPSNAKAATFTNLGAKCDGSTNDAAALIAASTALNTVGGGNIIIPSGKTCVIGANATVASTVALTFETAGELSISSDATLTINGPVLAPPTQIFSTVGGGVVAFTANHKLPTVYPQWWGAQCDGSTDDSTALQAAITASNYVAITVNSTCVFATGLTIVQNKTIQGTGTTSILKFTGTGVAITIAPVTGDGNMIVSNLAIDANSATVTAGIQITNTYAVTLDQLVMNGGGHAFTAAAIDVIGMRPSNSAIVRIENCHIQQARGDGVLLSGTAGMADITIIGNRIQANTGWGVNAPIGGTGAPVSEINIVSNDIEGNAAGGIYADSLFSSSIIGNHFENSADSTALGIDLGRNGASSGVVIQNNSFGGVAASYCIQFIGAGGSNGLQIIANRFTACSIGAIRFANGVKSDVVITANALGAGTPTLVVGSSFNRLLIVDANGLRYGSGYSDGPEPGVQFGGGVNYIAVETGSDNAIMGTFSTFPLNAVDPVRQGALNDGLCVTVQLAHKLQAGANTFNLNPAISPGPASIRSSRNAANNIATAYSASGRIRLCWNGTVWLDMSQ